MKKKVVRLVLTEGQKRKIKQILGIDCVVCELPVDSILNEGSGIKSLFDPKKKSMRLTKEQIEILREFHSKPPKSIIVDGNSAITMYGIGAEPLDDDLPEGLENYLDDI
jgi:hypothetical protein